MTKNAKYQRLVRATYQILAESTTAEKISRVTAKLQEPGLTDEQFAKFSKLLSHLLMQSRREISEKVASILMKMRD